MKTQKLIAGSNLDIWQRNVNDFLDQGWTIVPGTIQMFNHDACNNSYCVVVEKEDDGMNDDDRAPM